MTFDPLGRTSVDAELVRNDTQIRVRVHQTPPRFTARMVCDDRSCAHAPCEELTCKQPGCVDDTCTHAPVLFDGPMLLTSAFDMDIPMAVHMWTVLGGLLVQANSSNAIPERLKVAVLRAVDHAHQVIRACGQI